MIHIAKGEKFTIELDQTEEYNNSAFQYFEVKVGKRKIGGGRFKFDGSWFLNPPNWGWFEISIESIEPFLQLIEDLYQLGLEKAAKHDFWDQYWGEHFREHDMYNLNFDADENDLVYDILCGDGEYDYNDDIFVKGQVKHYTDCPSTLLIHPPSDFSFDNHDHRGFIKCMREMLPHLKQGDTTGEIFCVVNL